MSPAAGYTTPGESELPTRCGGCGEAVSSSDPGGYWMIDGTPSHTACVPWATRPFPYAWAIDLGRRALRRTSAETSGADRVRRAVAWLERAKLAWPTPDPVATLRIAAAAATLVQRAAATADRRAVA